MKFILLMFIGAIYLTVLCLIYLIHVNYFPINVVFYAAIADAIIATAVTGLIVFSIPVFRVLGTFERLQALVICFLTGYGLAISVPTVLDRSLSFYILEKLDQRGGGIRQDRFEQVFSQEYMKEFRLVDVRLTEQLESGTIRIVDGCVQLTRRGEILAWFSHTFRRHFLPKQRLLLGKYSDDLTDPFRHSIDTPEYLCSIKDK